MKTITIDEFLGFGPCWDEKDFVPYRKMQEQWSALDILRLPDVSDQDKLWAVLRPELVSDDILHEFACRCAEMALSLVEEPDPRSIAAIEAKRAWLRGEIDDKELGCG